MAVVSFPDCATDTNQTGDETIVAEDIYTELGYEFSVSAIVTPTPLGSYPDDKIRSGSAG